MMEKNSPVDQMLINEIVVHLEKDERYDLETVNSLLETFKTKRKNTSFLEFEKKIYLRKLINGLELIKKDL